MPLQGPFLVAEGRREVIKSGSNRHLELTVNIVFEHTVRVQGTERDGHQYDVDQLLDAPGDEGHDQSTAHFQVANDQSIPFGR